MEERLLEPEPVPWGRGRKVPSWALDEDAVAHRVPEDRKARGMILGSYTGAALGKAYIAFFGTWALWMVSPAFTYSYVLPTAGGGGFPAVPLWLWPLLGVCIICMLNGEHQVRSVLLVPIARSLTVEKPLPVPGDCLMGGGFGWWYFVNTLISAASHADVITNGIFVARVVASDQKHSRVSSLWRFIMEKSIIRAAGPVPLSHFVLLGWALMGAQAVYFLVHTFPIGIDIKGEMVEYNYGCVQLYKTLGDWYCSQPKALAAVLDVNRMSSLTTPYFQAEALELRSTTWGRFCLPMQFGGQLRNALYKLVLFAFLESAFQANLQAAGLGLTKAADPDHKADLVTVASLAIGMVVGINTLTKLYFKVRELATAIMEIDLAAELRANRAEFGWPPVAIEVYLEALMEGDWDDEYVSERVQPAVRVLADLLLGGKRFDQVKQVMNWGLTGSQYMQGGLEAQRSAWRRLYLFQFFSLLYLGLMARAAIQACAVLLCPTGLHDFGVGCLAI